MAENDIFDELDDRTDEQGLDGGDYADWWEPDDDDQSEELVGVVVEMHSAPEEWTEPGDVPDTIHTLMSVGRGGFEEGRLLTPKQHKQLKRGLREASIGDLVKAEFTGYEKAGGNMMMTYETGVIPEEEWKELDGADDVEELWDDHVMGGGIAGDNRRKEPYVGGAAAGGSAGGGGGPADGESEAAKSLQELLAVQGGEVDVETADQILNSVRDLDADVEEAAEEAGLAVDGGTISQ